MPRSYVAQALLFDQLTEQSEFLTGPARAPILLDQEGLKASVHKELSAIFNTRLSFPNAAVDALLAETDGEAALAGIEGMMGLPELRNAFAEGGAGTDDFAQACTRAIRLYEPRLRNPVVKVGGFDPLRQSLSLVIEGELVVGPRRENVSFAVAVRDSGE